MQFTKKEDAIFVSKPEGTDVRYYIYPEFEIHANEVKPGTVQGWHHHNVIAENLFILEGELEAHWLDDDGNKQIRTVVPGDVIQAGTTSHTFVNVSDTICKFLVFRFVPDGTDKHELIKNDRHPDVIN